MSLKDFRAKSLRDKIEEAVIVQKVAEVEAETEADEVKRSKKVKK